MLVSPKERKNGMTKGGMDSISLVDSRVRGNDAGVRSNSQPLLIHQIATVLLGLAMTILLRDDRKMWEFKIPLNPFVKGRVMITRFRVKPGMTDRGMDVGLFVDSRMRGNDAEDGMT